jgi:hypothetical protein
VPQLIRTAFAHKQMSRGLPAHPSPPISILGLEYSAPTSSTRISSCASSPTGLSKTTSPRCCLCLRHRHTHRLAIERPFPSRSQTTKTTTAAQSQSKFLTLRWSISRYICTSTSTPTASHVGVCDESLSRWSSQSVRIDSRRTLHSSEQCVGE